MNAQPQIESYRQGDVLIFRDRKVKERRGTPLSEASSVVHHVEPANTVDIGEEARGIVARLEAVNRISPVINRAKVEEGIQRHLSALGVAPLPVRWIEDAEAAYGAVYQKALQAASATRSAAWSAARSATRSAAWSATRSAAWSAAWSAAESAAWSAARSATRSAAWSAAESAARSAAESAAWSAARSAAWSAARSATRSAAWSAAWSAARSAARSAAESAAWSATRSAARSAAESAAESAGSVDPALERACGIWLPLADAFTAGLWLFWVCEDEVIVVPRPAIHVEGERLHRADGPAVEWPSGKRYFFWRGMQVPEDIIARPQDITISRIDSEQNAELRRVLLERYGVDRYMRESGSELLHQDEFGKLLRKNMLNDEPIVMVQVVNSTPEPDGTSKIYMLRVEPNLRPMLDGGGFGDPQAMTARNAVASTFGLRGEQYCPVVQT